MTNSEEWYGKMADNENSILKESYGNMTLSSTPSNDLHVNIVKSFLRRFDQLHWPSSGLK